MYKLGSCKFTLIFWLFVFAFDLIANGQTEIDDTSSDFKSNLIDGKGHFVDEPDIVKFSKTTAKLKLYPLLPESEANVTAFYVVVELRGKLVNKTLFDIDNVDLSLNYTQSKQFQTPFYAAFKLLPTELKESKEVTVGNNKVIGFYSNPPLKTDSEYRFGIAAAIDENKFIYLPSSRSFIPGEYSSEHHKSILWISVLGILFFIVLTLVAGLIYIHSTNTRQWRSLFIFWSKKTNRLSGGSIFKDINGTRSRDRLTLITPNVYEKEEEELPQERKSFNDIAAFETKSHPVHLKELMEYVTKMSESHGFKQEFGSVPRGQWAKWEEARLPDNKGKNRYGNLLAYDHSRVILNVDTNEEDDDVDDEMEIPINEDYAPTDYINASFIDGYKTKNRYIATQGPLQSTIKDFWKMVWQCDSRQIVMLTNVEELGKMKCDKYWPENTSSFGLIKVKLLKTSQFADYTIRKFSVQKKGMPEREVFQYHFTSWPDHSIPSYTTSLILFIRKIRENSEYKSTGKPIIVHCSAGVGRTGTLIAIDAMLQMAEQEKQVDVLSYLCTIRTQRVNMIDRLQQYVFVHQILVEVLSKDNTDIDCNQMDSYINRLKYYDAVTKKTLLESQFETLNKLYKVSTKEVCAAALANPTRNRNQDIVPSNTARVVFGSPEDYVNAVYINGYTSKDGFVVTEVPLPDTRHLFWKMIESLHIKLIVLLSDISSQEIYWPQNVEEKCVFGDIEVCFVDEKIDDKIAVRTFRVNNKTVKQYHLKSWIPSLKLSQCAQRLVDFLIKVEKHKNEVICNQMVVQCLNGYSSSGVYCGASFICERIKQEQRVDVFLASSTVRTHRRQFIEDLDQFNLLYEIAKCFTGRLPSFGLKQISA